MSKPTTRAERSVRLHFTEQHWRELERSAKDNYRMVNAEIAHRVVESLPREGE